MDKNSLFSVRYKDKKLKINPKAKFTPKQIANIKSILLLKMPLILAELFRFFIIFVFIPVYTTKPYTHRLVLRMDSRKIKLFIVSFYTLGSLVSFRYPVKVSRSSVGRSKLILPVMIFW